MSDQVDGGAEGQGTKAEATQAPAGGSGYKPPATQAELNELLAKNKKGIQRELAEARAQLETHQNLKSQVEQLLEGRPLEELIPEFEKSRQALMTAEQRLEETKKQSDKKLKETQERADKWEADYRNLKISRDIADALSDKASTPAARQHLIEMAAKRAQINPKTGEVEIEMEFEEEGVKVKKPVPPSKAIELMEGDVVNYGPFFKATVGSGTGTAAGGGHQRRLPNGMIDPSQMSMDEYVKHRAEILGVQK